MKQKTYSSDNVSQGFARAQAKARGLDAGQIAIIGLTGFSILSLAGLGYHMINGLQ